MSGSIPSTCNTSPCTTNGLSEELVRSQAYVQQAQHGLTHLQALQADVRRAEDLSGLLEQFTALYGLPLDRDAANALSGRMGGLFISLDTLARDKVLFDLARGYHDALLSPALFGLSAYDTLIDLLIEALDFPELAALHARTDDLARDLDAYVREIDETPALLRGNEKVILRKQETLSALFRPERLEGHAPAPDAIETVRTFLQNTEHYQNGFLQQLFIQLLGGSRDAAPRAAGRRPGGHPRHKGHRGHAEHTTHRRHTDHTEPKACASQATQASSGTAHWRCAHSAHLPLANASHRHGRAV